MTAPITGRGPDGRLSRRQKAELERAARGEHPRPPRTDRKQKQRPPLWDTPESQARRAVSRNADEQHSDTYGDCRVCESHRTAVLTLEKHRLDHGAHPRITAGIKAALERWKNHLRHELPAPLFAAATKPIITKHRSRHLAQWRDTTHQARPPR